MFDRRKLTSGGFGSPIHIFEGHNAAVLCVQVLEADIMRLSSFLIFELVNPEIRFGWILQISINYKKCSFQWSPDRSSVFGSSAEDGILNIWDQEKVASCTCF